MPDVTKSEAQTPKAGCDAVAAILINAYLTSYRDVRSSVCSVIFVLIYFLVLVSF